MHLSNQNKDTKIYLLDDQSTEIVYTNKLKKFFKNNFIKTLSFKSKNNCFNQLNAISFFIKKIGIKKNEFYWFIDGDDSSINNASDYIIPILKNNYENNLFILEGEEHGIFETKKIIPELKYPLWYRNSPTSSLILKGLILINNHNKIFKNFFNDVWFDMRVLINTNKKKTYLIKDKILYLKESHKGNDSLRYKNSLFTKYFRILKTILYFFYSRITY